MEERIVILLILSTVLACWSFSLLLRLVSEFVARKRKRLRAEHRRKGVVMALVAMTLGLIGSVFSGWFAVSIAKQTNTDEVGDAEIVVAIAAGLVLFALLLLVWAIIGDRSRGRLRCPRCWYDMEGIETPQCPECGKAIRSDRHLRKARRMKWPFALASVLIGCAVYGFVHLERVEETDSFALMPTWVLMLGWDVLPEDWILSENSTYYSTLEARLSYWYEYWHDADRNDRFYRRLISGFEGSIEDRWNERRLHLLNGVDSDDPIRVLKLFSHIDQERVAQNAAREMYYAVEYSSNYATDYRVKLIIDRPRQLSPLSHVRASFSYLKALELDQSLSFDHDDFDSFRLYRAMDRTGHEFDTKYLHPLGTEFDSRLLYTTAMNDALLQDIAFDLLATTGLNLEVYMDVVRLSEDDLNENDEMYYNAHRILIPAIQYIPDDEARQFYQALIESLRNGGVMRKTLALSVLRICIRYRDTDYLPLSHEAELMETISIQRYLAENNNQLLVLEGRENNMLNQFALGNLMTAMPSDPIVWDLARRSLTEFGKAPYFDWSYEPDADSFALDWMDVFGRYIHDPDPQVRLWAMNSLPINEQSCLSDKDARVFAIAYGMGDENEDVRSEADWHLRYEEADQYFETDEWQGWYD